MLLFFVLCLFVCLFFFMCVCCFFLSTLAHFLVFGCMFAKARSETQGKSSNYIYNGIKIKIKILICLFPFNLFLFSRFTITIKYWNIKWFSGWHASFLWIQLIVNCLSLKFFVFLKLVQNYTVLFSETIMFAGVLLMT